MTTLLKRMSLLAINYITILPLLFFLIATNQNKELSKLLSILKTSSEI